jgi:hypothetical protein
MAIGASTAVSTASPSNAPTFAFFLANPYVPNEKVRISAIHGGLPYSIVSSATATNARPSATHCHARSRSPSTETPSSTVNNGLMKYPNEVSTTCPLLTPQMYVPQLNAIRIAAAARIRRARRFTTTARSRLVRPIATIKATTNRPDHTTRLARISAAPAGLSSGQYRGNSPQIKNAEAPKSKPRRCSSTTQCYLQSLHAGDSRPTDRLVHQAVLSSLPHPGYPATRVCRSRPRNAGPTARARPPTT